MKPTSEVFAEVVSRQCPLRGEVGLCQERGSSNSGFSPFFVKADDDTVYFGRQRFEKAAPGLSNQEVSRLEVAKIMQ